MGIVKITPAGEKISCRAGESTKFQFSVSNASGGPLRCGIDVRADGDAGKWLSVDGGVERDLSEGVDTTIHVKVAPPKNLLDANAPEQTYTFRLRVYDAQNTESAEDSATVSVVVKPAEKTEKKCLWCWLVPVIAAAVVVLGLSIWLLWPSAKVPELTGKVYTADVETQLMDQNFAISITEKPSDTEPGTILEQSPLAGEPVPKVAKGEQVPLSLSISAISVQVPKLVGKMVTDAEQALQAVGLKVGEIIEDASATRGLESAMVVAQNPEENTPVLPGSEINLTIPLQTIIVPAVTGLRFDEATQALEQIGLRVTMETRSTHQAQQGLITSQIPLAGAQAKVGSTIKVIVEKTIVTLPNVVGSSPQEAIAKLTNAGLKIKSTYEGRAAVGAAVKVASQSPRGSTNVDLGSTVTIVYPRQGLVFTKEYLVPNAGLYKAIPRIK